MPLDRPVSPDEPVDVGEIRRRALAGLAFLGTRGVLLQILALAGNIVVARLLLPREVGVVAVGLTVLALGTVLVDAGLGAALVRRGRAPEQADLETLLTLQLGAGVGAAAAVSAASLPFGSEGSVVAVMAAALPLIAFRSSARVLLERALSYRRLVTVEVAEASAYYAWAIATVAAGWGIWGLATATLARAFVGTAGALWVAPVRILRPRLTRSRVRGLVGFGSRYQGSSLAVLVREQAVNVGAAAIGGLPLLGLWTLASRIMQAPFLLFSPMWRVSYPAMSRLVADGENAGSTISRVLPLTAAATGAILAPLAASAAAFVPAAFGQRWRDVADVVPSAALGLMIAGPISVAFVGYLYAIGDAAAPLRAVTAASLGWGVGLGLLPVIGVAALGIGWLAASLIEAGLLRAAVIGRLRVSVVAPLAVPTAAALAAAAVGWLVSRSLGPTLTSGVAGAAVAEAGYLLALRLARPTLLRELFAGVRAVVRAASKTDASLA